MLIIDLFNIAKQTGEKLAKLEGRLLEIHNASCFASKKEKELLLQEYIEKLKEKKELYYQIDESVAYLEKFTNDIGKFKSGYFRDLMHSRRASKLKKSIKDYIEIEKIEPEIKLLDSPINY